MKKFNLKFNKSFILSIILFVSFIFLLYETWGFYNFLSTPFSLENSGIISEEGKVPTILNFLVSGIDGSNGLEKARSDIIMIISVNTKDEKAYIISIPRDSRVEIIGHGRQKINHARSYGGILLMRQTIEKLLSVEIDYYFEVNFETFKVIVDKLGGIPFTVKYNMFDNLTEPHINVPAGTYRLNGDQALGVIRYRNYPMGDIDRIKVQQEFFMAFVKEFVKPERLLQIRQFSDIFFSNVKTDLPYSDLIPLAFALKNISFNEIEFKTIPGKANNINGIDYWILDENELEKIKNEIIFKR